ncbi:hypothetical protein EAG18_10910 [Pseudoalteromonas sp. J010]|uniref:hypothetical protein n=1 Tax=Pseudoalteromonas sp. J010 TaxID=998465 RepID=UPI000F64F6F2|nr:hypothetical protein [Pseudoalteromonas sp. J010]RRS08697.1 hypothetical protein EAG18_10910 [Pseudoalteromonas sp. J010]
MSTVGCRLDEAIQKISAGDLENALIQVSIAIDVSSKRKWPKQKKVGERYKNFIREHESLIYFMLLGIKGDTKPLVSFPNPNGDRYDIAHVYYKAVRNGLLHDGKISDNLSVVDENVLIYKDGKITISKMILMALMLAVICEPVNCNERLSKSYTVTFTNDIDINLNDFWGKRELLYQKIGHDKA